MPPVPQHKDTAADPISKDSRARRRPSSTPEVGPSSSPMLERVFRAPIADDRAAAAEENEGKGGWKAATVQPEWHARNERGRRRLFIVRSRACVKECPTVVALSGLARRYLFVSKASSQHRHTSSNMVDTSASPAQKCLYLFKMKTMCTSTPCLSLREYKYVLRDEPVAFVNGNLTSSCPQFPINFY